nr:hypothetical protein [Tanacetum cinerariifolium]
MASNSPPRVIAVKALVVSVAQGMKGQWEWRPKCLILDHVSRTTSALMTLKSDGYHVVPPPYTRTLMPPKLDLVFNTAPTAIETDHPAFTVQLSPTKHAQALSHINRPTTPIIEDWVSDSEDE